MIDWLSLNMDGSLLSPDVRQLFQARQDRILRISSAGEMVWETWARESIRSDTHQVMARLSDRLEISGSPARVKESDNVFGTDDIQSCARSMISFVCRTLGVILPADITTWNCTRVDITQNYLLDCLEDVKQALNYLRHSEGGRYQVRTSAETVYWSPSSRLRSGKAYAKGPHLNYLIKKGMLQISDEKLTAAQNLLRLELRIGSQYWRERSTKPWHEHTPDDLKQIHNDYFKQFIGQVEIMEKDSVYDSLLEVTTPGQAKAAYRTWCLIKSQGMESARELSSKATWYRHKKLLNLVGISWADFHEQKIVPFRRKTIVLNDPVESWDDLLANQKEKLHA